MDDLILIGLDLGTTNAKAAAYNLSGEAVAQASVGYPTLYPRPGQAEQRPSDWIAALSDALRQVAAGLGARRLNVAGIGLSAHGPGLVLVGDDGLPLLDTCPTWQDERCLPQGRRLLEEVGADWIGLGMPLSGFPARLLWVVETHPEVTARARYALGIKDYLLWWLTGQYAAEPSSGPGDSQWWPPVFEACGWSLERLAPVLPSRAVAGAVRTTLADEFGLPRGVPVVMGMNDGASATLGSGLIDPGDNMVTLGTNGVGRVVLSEPISPQHRLDFSLFCWPYIDSLWVAGGFAKCGAAALDWFANLITDQPGPGDFDRVLNEAAQSVPGSRGVIFVPYLAGRGAPHGNPEAKACFVNLTLAHGRADLARAVLEGVAFAIREIYDHFAASGLVLERAHISGGGARSPIWRQIVADVLDRPLIHCGGDSTLGAAVVTAVGLELYDDFPQAVRAMTRPLGQTTPQPDIVEIYWQAFEEFQRLRDGQTQFEPHEPIITHPLGART